MESLSRIEQTLEEVVSRVTDEAAPPTLAAAMRHAVFPGGARVRPQLTLAVAQACECDAPKTALATAAAIELLHCASLVHDDMPCFDNADTRRGRASVHSAYGESTALLAGDALIVLAFETLGRSAASAPERLGAIITAVARGTGMPAGIAAGQAWETEQGATAEICRRQKTGALFVTATMCGALASGRDPGSWRLLGEKIGEAYQIADDLYDAAGDASAADKPLGQDVIHDRPNAVSELGLLGAVDRLKSLVDEAVASIPICPGASDLANIVRVQAKRLAPDGLVRTAA